MKESVYENSCRMRARGSQRACTLHRAALGVVNLVLDTVEIFNKDRGNRGVKMRAETREKGRQIIGRGHEGEERGGLQHWIGQLGHPGAEFLYSGWKVRLGGHNKVSLCLVEVMRLLDCS